MTDYNALAKQFGGSTGAVAPVAPVTPTPSLLPKASKPVVLPTASNQTTTSTPAVILPKNTKPAPIDYTALASKFGATQSAPPPEPAPFKYDVPLTQQSKIQKYQAEAEVAKQKADKANSFTEKYLRPVADSILPGTASLGDTIGGIINTNTLTDDHTKTMQNIGNTQLALMKKIQADDKAGKDTTHLKQMYNDGVDSLGRLQDQYNEATGGAKKTWQQVLGEIGMTGLNVLTAGTYDGIAGEAKGAITKIASGALPEVGNAGKLAVTGKITGAVSKLLPESASYTAKKVLPTAVEDATKAFTAKKLLPKIGRVVEGAAIGEGYDATQNLQEGKTGTDVLTDGYAKYLGGAIPAVLEGAGAVTRKIGSLTPAQAEERLANNLNETFKKGTIGVKNIADFADERGINLGKELVDRRIRPIVENDRLKFGTEPFKQLDTEIANDSQVIDKVLEQYPDTKVSASDLKSEVARQISSDPIASRQGETESLIKQAQSKIDDYARQKGRTDFTLPEIQEFKKGAWELSKKFKVSDIGKSDASSYLGTAFKNVIEKEVPDANIRAINQKIGRAQEVYKLLDKTNSLQDGGIVLKGGKIGKYGSKVAGATAGAIVGTTVGGPIGGVAGAYAGAKVSDLIRNISQKAEILGPLDRILLKFADKAPEDAAILEARQFIDDVKAGKKPTVTPRVQETLQRAYENKAKVLPPDEVKQMEMGTYKLRKNPVTGIVEPTGDYRKPGINFYPPKPVEPTEMGTYKLGKNDEVKYRKPDANFYPSKNSEPRISSKSEKSILGSDARSLPEQKNTTKTTTANIPKGDIKGSVQPPVKKSKYLPRNEGFAKAKALLAGGAVAGGVALANIPYKATYTAKPVELPKTDSINVPKLQSAIASNETGGEKTPYTFSQPSGDKKLGKALGKYQVTEGELKSYGEKLLGEHITAKEFLASPKLQDQYIQAKIKYLQGKGLTTASQILAAHRGGFSNLDAIPSKIKQYQDYVDKGLLVYKK